MDFPELGGDEEDRTLDLTDANRTLSQVVRKAGPFFLSLKSALFVLGCEPHSGKIARGSHSFYTFSITWLLSYKILINIRIRIGPIYALYTMYDMYYRWA
ncbi:hypothetical protein SDC9_58656 [bioreactor metagenome]|uniref:Uncharacterized protein n=1 Tax=bioreactor metagenome TaxID=1076179 RepID=A0A644XDN1_9ZZZZ